MGLRLSSLVGVRLVMFFVFSHISLEVGATQPGSAEVDSLREELLGCHNLLERFASEMKSLQLPTGTFSGTNVQSDLVRRIVEVSDPEKVDGILLEVILQGRKSRAELMSFGNTISSLSASTQNQLIDEQAKLEKLIRVVQDSVNTLQLSSGGVMSASLVPLDQRDDSVNDRNRRRIVSASRTLAQELKKFERQAQIVYESMDKTIEMWRQVETAIAHKRIELKHTWDELLSVSKLLPPEMKIKSRVDSAANTLGELNDYLRAFDGVPEKIINQTEILRDVLKIRAVNFTGDLVRGLRELNWIGSTNALTAYMETHLDDAQPFFSPGAIVPDIAVIEPTRVPTAVPTIAELRAKRDAQKLKQSSGVPNSVPNGNKPTLAELRAKRAQRQSKSEPRQQRDEKLGNTNE